MDLTTLTVQKLLTIPMGKEIWITGNMCADTLGNLYFCVGKSTAHFVKVNLGKDLVWPMPMPAEQTP